MIKIIFEIATLITVYIVYWISFFQIKKFIRKYQFNENIQALSIIVVNNTKILEYIDEYILAYQKVPVNCITQKEYKNFCECHISLKLTKLVKDDLNIKIKSRISMKVCKYILTKYNYYTIINTIFMEEMKNIEED